MKKRAGVIFVGALALAAAGMWLSLAAAENPGAGEQKDIFSAVGAGDLALVRAMLQKDKALVNARDERGATPLHMAAEMGQTEIVKLLLGSGANPNALAGEVGLTPLHMVCYDAFELAPATALEIARLLIAAGADVKKPDREGATPLHSAQDPQLLELLLGKGADPNARDNTGQTPLHNAVTVETARILIAHGARINAKDNDGQTPIQIALDNGNEPLFEFLLSKGADFDPVELGKARAEFKYGQARSLLTSLFTAEVAYFGEKSAYAGQAGPNAFTDLGWAPGGPVVYNVFVGPDKSPCTAPGCDPCAQTKNDSVVAKTAFTLMAAGNLDKDELCDVWTINDAMVLTHATSDLP